MPVTVLGRRWDELTSDQRKSSVASMVRQVLFAVVRIVLLWVALRDIQRRPPEAIRGSKRLWRFVVLLHGLGTLAYFLFGRVQPQEH